MSESSVSSEDKLAAEVERTTLAADLAKLDLIEARGRHEFDDDRLNLLDIAAIGRCATEFGVTRHMAYHRAKSLGMLSYQRERQPASPHPDPRGSDTRGDAT